MAQHQASVMHLGRLDPAVGRLMPFMPELAVRLARGPVFSSELSAVPVDLLCETELLRPEGDGGLVPGPNLVVFAPEMLHYLTESTRDAVTHGLDGLRRGGLRRLAEACVAAEGWDWGRDCHTVACALLMDLALAGALHRGRFIPARPKSFWIWAFLGGGETRHRVGTIISGSPHLATGAGLLWAGSPPARRLNLNRAAVTLLDAVVAGTGTESVDPATRMVLQYYGIIGQDGGRLVPRVPVLRCFANSPLWEAVEAEAAALAAVLGPALSVADSLVGEHGIADLGAARHAAFRILLDHLVDEAITGGLLPPLPADRSGAWGHWIWTEDPVRKPFTSSRSAFHTEGIQGDEGR